MDKYQTVIWSFKRQQTSPRQPVRKFSATYISFYLNTKKTGEKTCYILNVKPLFIGLKLIIFLL